MSEAQGSKQDMIQKPGKSKIVENGTVLKVVKGKNGSLQAGGLPSQMDTKQGGK